MRLFSSPEDRPAHRHLPRGALGAPHLATRLAAATERDGKVVFIDGDVHVTVPWVELHQQARAAAAGLQARGIGPGSHVALLGPTTRSLVTNIHAVWLAGATVMVLPLPMRMGSIEEFVDQTRVRLMAGDAELLLIDPQFAPFVEPVDTDPPFVLMDALADGHTADELRPPSYDPDELAILQFTSGSTADPKGVMLPHRTVCANLDAIYEATTFDPEGDVLVSWLPLYHDMGLVGILGITSTTGADLVLAGPQDFLASPSRWVEWLSTYRATATAGPNFAWVLATKALRRLEGLDLSRLRVALNGAEPVDPETVEAFIDAGARHGLQPGAMFPAFGMAEVAIAGAFPEPGRGLVTDLVDGRVLETEHYAAPASDPDAPTSRRLAKLGRPVPGLEMRICDPGDGRVLAEREVGELEIRGTSVTPGYYRRPDLSDEVFHDGWLRTGDLAYLVDGELVLCGRIKDLIIVAGRNVHPQDIEKAVGHVEGVRAGNVIAFGVPGRRGQEGIVVVAECRADDPDEVHAAVGAAVRHSVGVAALDVVLVTPGTLPKTSSGKLQRQRCRQWYLDRQLEPVRVGGG